MDGFSYSDIFATKGMEYLIIIAFLLLLIPFSVILNKQVKITHKIRQVFGILTAGNLKIPQGLFYSKNHTWAHLDKSGAASVGLDDLLLHLTGEVTLSNLRDPGEYVNKGDVIASIGHMGKFLRIFSPISGEIMSTNSIIRDSPGILNEDPYGKGWVYKIKPSDWMAETRSLYLAEEATAWLKRDLDRFKDFLAVTMMKYSPGTSGIILQDGGELCDHSLSALPFEIWQDFQQEFLNPEEGRET